MPDQQDERDAAIVLLAVQARYEWSAELLRYRDTVTGQFVSADSIRRALSRVVEASQRKIVRLAQELNNGTIGVQVWQERMELAVKELHLAATAAGKGGFASMTQRDYGLAGARLLFHYERIDVFARMIEEGRLSAGQIVARAKLYANGGRGVYENSRREAARVSEMTEERRVLGNAEHCGVCVEEAAKGWQTIGTLRRLGDSPCRANCRCSFVFRKGDAREAA